MTPHPNQISFLSLRASSIVRRARDRNRNRNRSRLIPAIFTLSLAAGILFPAATPASAATLEAEAATLTGVSVRAHAGASGGARVVNWAEAGDAVEWTGVPAGQSLRISYSLGQTMVRQAGLYVNGARRDTLYFYPTDNWDQYDTLTYYPRIEAGASLAIRLDPADVAVNLGGSSASIDKVDIESGAPPVSAWVHPGPNGRLMYEPDARGNRVPDFSTVGYRRGGVPIPDIPTRATVEPGPGDDAARIHAAIAQVAQLPIGPDGYRGAVLLKAGTYEIADHIRVGTSGIVLRGEGSETTGTVLLGTGTTQRTLVRFEGVGSRSQSGPTRSMIEPYVPVGAWSFLVDNASDMAVGDQIIVRRPSTAEWIHDIGMDQIPPRTDGTPITQWAPGAYDLYFDRVITAIEGNRITIDAPLVNSFEAQYGYGTVYRYEYTGRIENVGIEHIRGESTFTSATDEAHAWSFLAFDRMQNGWARDIKTRYFGFQSISVGSSAKWVTVQDGEALEPRSTISGSRRYPFHISGQLSLFERCYARHNRHDYAMNARVPGPNVFVDCSADTSYADTGPHHRWATGTLHDNLRIRDNEINARNRGNSGTGHGWAGANMVLWNCEAKGMIIEQPPTAQNWSIGSITANGRGNGYWDQKNTRVAPRSLYRTQLAERLAGQSSATAWTLY